MLAIHIQTRTKQKHWLRITYHSDCLIIEKHKVLSTQRDKGTDNENAIKVSNEEDIIIKPILVSTVNQDQSNTSSKETSTSSFNKTMNIKKQ